DADVVLLAIDDRRARYGRIQHGELLQALDDLTDDEGERGELLPRVALELRAHALTDPSDAGQIDLEERGDVRGGATRGDHVVAGQGAHFRHRLDAGARPGLRDRAM